MRALQYVECHNIAAGYYYDPYVAHPSFSNLLPIGILAGAAGTGLMVATFTGYVHPMTAASLVVTAAVACSTGYTMGYSEGYYAHCAPAHYYGW